MKDFNLVRENSYDIGFATDCVIVGAITFYEFKEWVHFVIEQSGSWPTYLLEILELDARSNFPLEIGRILGFWPGWGATDQEHLALDGIGFKRFPDYQTDSSVKEDALKALEQNPHVEKKFRELFPFIEW